MAQIQFSLMKKEKNWKPRTLANPHPPKFYKIPFLPYHLPHPTSETTSYMHHPLLHDFNAPENMQDGRTFCDL